MSRKEGLNAAPIPDQWYTLTLGSSFKDHHPQPSPKISTLRYDFMPASVDKTQPGTLHRRKDKINVEHNHVQPGKPKFNFEGTGETLNENDAVMYFDGSTFRLERLHRSVNRLKHCRLPGEQHPPLDPTSSPSLGRGVPLKPNASARPSTFTPPRPLPPPPLPPPPPLSVEVERMDIGEVERVNIDEGERMDIGEVERMDIGEVERTDIGEVERIDIGGKSRSDKSPPPEHNATISPDFDLEAHLDIMNDDDDDDEAFGPDKSAAAAFTGIDINLPHQNDTDDEIADVDVNDDNGVMGGNAAAALRALVHKEEKEEQTSSSSASSGSESSASSSRSGSGSSQSSSDSDGNSSDGDTVNSI
ncbi:uncharacterized protein LOC141586958 isoform X1 [Silene latifolia]|uniref:uncharacterized protein LOC141586958 isoform X1 n=2 Tax=Silene latifolia TaxID=37657 RepID=UPI003D7853F8